MTALSLGVLMMASACSVANTESDASENTLRIVLPQEPPTLEPCESSLTSTGAVVRSNITEPLIERDPTTGKLEPLLATKWEATSDTEWTFTLREGVKFHDGTAFTAEAAAFSIDRAVGSELGCNVDGYVFGGSELTTKVVNDTTLTVTSKTPDPVLPLRLSFVEIVPTSTSTTAKVREPLGTGPYQIGKWETGIRLDLNRYADYWGEAPAYAKVQYTWRGEGSVRAAMVNSGEAEVAVGLGPEDGAGDRAVAYPNNETTALRFDATKAPLDDIRIRRAINYAIDNEGLVSSLFDGLGKSAGQLVPPGVVGYNPNIATWPFDMAKAKDLVAQAKADGTPVDTQITLVARNAQFPKVAETAEVLQNALTQAGLNVKIQMLETAAHLEYQLRPFPADRGPTVLLIMHGNQAGDAAFTTGQYMSSTGAQSTFGTPELDALIAAAEQKFGDERQAAFEKVLAYQNDNVVQFAHLAHMSGILALAPGVTYQPDAATGDEMRLADIRPAS